MPYEFKANGPVIEIYKLYKTVPNKLVKKCKTIETAHKYIAKRNLEDYKQSSIAKHNDDNFLNSVKKKHNFCKWAMDYRTLFKPIKYK